MQVAEPRAVTRIQLPILSALSEQIEISADRVKQVNQQRGLMGYVPSHKDNVKIQAPNEVEGGSNCAIKNSATVGLICLALYCKQLQAEDF